MPIKPVKRTTTSKMVSVDIAKVKSSAQTLRTSPDEQKKFAQDPIAYLKRLGVQIPDSLAVELKANASHLHEVLTGKHDMVASIAIA